MKAETTNKYPALLMMFMILSTLCKIYFMYLNTFTPNNTVLALIRTMIILVTVYFILNYILFRKNLVLKLLIHELLAVIILADILYFKYFNTLPSGTDLQMLPAIPAIWDSIKELFEVNYALLFADMIPMLICQLIWGRKLIIYKRGLRLQWIIATLLVIAVSIDCGMFGSSNSYQNFDSFGLIHFHGSQFKEMLLSKESYNKNTLSIKSLEEVSKKYSIQPKHFGIARDRNVIMIQVEALQGFTVNRYYNSQEITPNLNKLIRQETLYFDNYYHHIAKGGTSDAEFTTLHSLYPASDLPSYNKYVDKSLYGLPKILKDKGYSSIAFHGFKPEFWNRAEMYSSIGFDKFVSGSELKKSDVIGWGISDKAFFKQVSRYLTKVKQPVFAFSVTLSNHYPYNLPEKYKTFKLPEQPQNNFIGRYLQSINYTDAAIGEFIAELRKSGLYENSIIAIYGDHHAINNTDIRLYRQMSQLLGYKYSLEEMTKVPLIIHIPNTELNETITTVGGQLDFLPTMLNLLGIQEGNIKFYGQDLCNAKSGFATTQMMLPKGSFIDEEKVFIMSADGIFEHGKAWNRMTKEPISTALCRGGYEKVMKETEECSYMLSNDLLLKIDVEANKEVSSRNHLDMFKYKILQIINSAIK
ncbi:MAG TPA: LTA synthase family protein [Patescibacteria group bacterium]|nr:LTA synthase family protein [Patescibacteria group bacterium]